MKEQVGELTVRLDRIEKVRMNATKVYPFDRIEKIGRHIRGIGYEEPVYFPKNAAYFWKLRIKRDDDDRNSKHLPKTNYDTSLLIQIAKLLKYLVEFYGIDDYQYWGKTHSEWDVTDEGQPDEGHSDGGESHSELSMSLEEAAKEYLPGRSKTLQQSLACFAAVDGEAN
jgi:hypothetical protein